MAGEGRKKLLYLGVLISILLLVGIGFMGGDQQEEEAARVGAIAPNFRLENLTGEKVELKKIYRQNQLTLVNFWATWCPPCRVEIPELTRFYQEYQAKGVEILAVNIWDNTSRGQLQTFADAAEMKFPVLVDVEDKTANQYQIRAVPTTIFIDQTGRIREVYMGALSYSQLQTRFERYKAAQ
ncbi:MAG: redoxin domain-containing protein [Firmicutes bacterium]|nr:redoxin domain-containing protein [Bacillota bacterium]